MSYATYSQYTTDYFGTQISSMDFARLALRASETLDLLTYDRISAIILAGIDIATIAKIVKATCALAEEIQTLETTPDGITSETEGRHSVSYGANAKAALTEEQRLAKVAKLYLGNTGLMFKGFADGEYSGSVSDDN